MAYKEGKLPFLAGESATALYGKLLDWFPVMRLFTLSICLILYSLDSKYFEDFWLFTCPKAVYYGDVPWWRLILFAVPFFGNRTCFTLKWFPRFQLSKFARSFSYWLSREIVSCACWLSCQSTPSSWESALDRAPAPGSLVANVLLPVKLESFHFIAPPPKLVLWFPPPLD